MFFERLQSAAPVVRRLAATLALTVVVSTTATGLRWEGRLWTCSCGEVFLWAGDIHSAHNSQHLFDPYTFTHLLHGIILFWLAFLLVPRIWPVWQLTLAVGLEGIWELIENSPFVIERYRTATIALGYQGDTVLNSMGDMLICAVGFELARRIGWRMSIVLFLATEAALVILIRDSLLLNVVMLFYPVEAIKTWQMGY